MRLAIAKPANRRRSRHRLPRQPNSHHGPGAGRSLRLPSCASWRRPTAPRIPAGSPPSCGAKAFTRPTLTDWRRQRDAGAFAALKPQRRGPRLEVAKPAAELDQLRRENARLRQRLEHAEAIIGIQKKVAALLGMPMATTARDETP
jgi:hypothetical protein